MGSACSSRSARPELSAIVDRGLPPQAKEQHTEQEPRAQDVVTEITDTEFSVGARLRLLESDSHQLQCVTITGRVGNQVTFAVDNESDRPREQSVAAMLPRVLSVIPETERYSAGQRLLIVWEGLLVDASVKASVEDPLRPACHILCLSDGRECEMDLNPANHCCQQLASVEAYKATAQAYCEHLKELTVHVEDAITGNKLSTKHQLMPLGLRAREGGAQLDEFQKVQTAADLQAKFASVSQPVLLLGTPGTGKTWCCQQLIHVLANQCEKAFSSDNSSTPVPLLPVLIYVRRLDKILKGRDDTKPLDEEVLLEYLAAEFANQPEYLQMLRMALEMRALAIVLDGLDESFMLRQALETFVCKVLVPAGFGLLCTSRPEGVRLHCFADRFVIFDLSALSDAQQNAVIRSQVQFASAELLEHAAALSQIRSTHDRIYTETAFPSEKDRDRIERFSAPDLSFINGKDGERAKHLRQKTRGGKWVAVHRGPPQSKYLQALCRDLTPDVLARIDKVLEPMDPTALSDEVRAAIQEEVVAVVATPELMSRRSEEERSDFKRSIFELALLVHKRRHVQGAHLDKIRKWVPQAAAATLWPTIVARLDQYYTVTEGLLEVVKEVIPQLVAAAGLDPASGRLTIGPIKHPVRLHEKALDDYLEDFDDWHDDIVVPEACVRDMIRARVVCTNGGSLLSMMEALKGGFEVDVDGKMAKLSLLRCKNKFDPSKGDPSHHRCVLMNLILEYDYITAPCVEVQVFHEATLEYNESSHAHDHYYYFKGVMQEQNPLDFDAWLERVISFLDTVRGVPVLFSMLVLVLAQPESGNMRFGELLPTSKFELFERAIELSVQRGVEPAMELSAQRGDVARMLRRVAARNQLAMTREFSSHDVEECLSAHPDQLQLWHELNRAESVPMLKLLFRGMHEQVYQFKHLSLQEAGLVLAIIKDGYAWDTWKSDPTAVLLEPFFENTLQIGGGLLGKTLALRDGVWDLTLLSSRADHSGVAMRGLLSLLQFASIWRFPADAIVPDHVVELEEALPEEGQSLTHIGKPPQLNLGWTSLQPVGPAQHSSIWSRLDVDSSGRVDRSEFVACMLHSGFDSSKIESMWQSMEPGSDGTVDQARFEAAIQTNPEIQTALTHEAVSLADHLEVLWEGCKVLNAEETLKVNVGEAAEVVALLPALTSADVGKVITMEGAGAREGKGSIFIDGVHRFVYWPPSTKVFTKAASKQRIKMVDMRIGGGVDLVDVETGERDIQTDEDDDWYFQNPILQEDGVNKVVPIGTIMESEGWALSTLGVRWTSIGHEKPTKGNEIHDDALAAVLQKQTKISPEEIKRLDLIGLADDSFIKVGDEYFEQAAAEGCLLSLVAPTWRRASEFLLSTSMGYGDGEVSAMVVRSGSAGFSGTRDPNVLMEVKLRPMLWRLDPEAIQGLRLRSPSWCATVQSADHTFDDALASRSFHNKSTQLSCAVDNKEEANLTLRCEHGPLAIMSYGDAQQVLKQPLPWRLVVEGQQIFQARRLIIEVSTAPVYKVSQPLMVVHHDSLIDATVEAYLGTALRPTYYQLRVREESLSAVGESSLKMDLNEFNHTRQRLESVDAYEAARTSFCNRLQHQTKDVFDAITGVRLDISRQTLKINTESSRGVRREEYGVSSIQELAPLMLGELYDLTPRVWGAHHSQPVIVEAPPGTGKTWGALQLANELATHAGLGRSVSSSGSLSPSAHFRPVPVLIFVQRLMRKLRGIDPSRQLTETQLLQYFVDEVEDSKSAHLRDQWLLMLTQALEMRALVLIVDGIDEASGLRDAVSGLVLDLAAKGVQLAATSRPEGINLDLFKDSFVVLGLKKLDEDQVRQAVNWQLEESPDGREFSDHLLKFSDIRTGHDHIYSSHFTDEERASIESIQDENRFLLPEPWHGCHLDIDGKAYDRAMIQHCADGSRVVRPRKGSLRSKYLKRLNQVMAPALTKLDECFKQKAADYESALLAVKDTDVPLVIATRLAQLVVRRRKGDPPLTPPEPTCMPSKLWTDLCVRTDEIYEVVEQLGSDFQSAMRELMSRAGIDPAATAVELSHPAPGGPSTIKTLMIAPGLKDPVRLHEKAVDGYANRFSDCLPEACITDMLRARAVCVTADQMIHLLQALIEGYETLVDKRRVRLHMLRCKNKFCDADRDPVGFRNVLNNLRMVVSTPKGEMSTVVELQVHHAAIYGHNEDSHSHDHYEFFRSQLPGSAYKKLDSALERVIGFLMEVQGIPVLLSMLILCLSKRQVNVDGLPSNRLELYKMALEGVIRARCSSLEAAGQPVTVEAAMTIFYRIAVESMRIQRREFTSNDVRRVLDDQQWAIWLMLADTENDHTRPLIKTLETEDSRGYGGLYQFRHLSFQEALLPLQLTQEGEEATWGNGREIATLLTDPWFVNACRIGGRYLGDAFVKRRCEIDFRREGDNGVYVSERAMKSLKQLHLAPTMRPIRFHIENEDT